MRVWMARASAVVATCLLLAVGAAAFEFKDEDRRFSAVFPAAPILEEEEGNTEIGPAMHYNWKVEQGDRTFVVTCTVYSRPVAKNYDKNVRALRDSGAKLLRHQVIDVSGVDGREIYAEVLENPQKEILRLRIALVGNRFYHVFYRGPFGTESRADVEEFMASFQLLK